VKRDRQKPQAPHPWRRQVEANIFYKRRGWWRAAHEAARDEASRARLRQFFGWPPPPDTVRLNEIFQAVFSERSAAIADLVDGNALLRRVR
jgi:hypothetical protein